MQLHNSNKKKTFCIFYFPFKMAVQKISGNVGMCLKIGTPLQVASRRVMVDIKEMLNNNEMLKHSSKLMISESEREGFRLNSDIDIMRWPNNHQVIWDFSQCQIYNTQELTVFLCDNSESPPGFTLLWLPLERARPTVSPACVRMHGGLYISSSKYREIRCSLSNIGSTIHGPCSSGILGETEYDISHCFVSDFLPPSASSWRERDVTHGPHLMLSTTLSETDVTL